MQWVDEIRGGRQQPSHYTQNSCTSGLGFALITGIKTDFIHIPTKHFSVFIITRRISIFDRPVYWSIAIKILLACEALNNILEPPFLTAYFHINPIYGPNLSLLVKVNIEFVLLPIFKSL